MIDSQSALAGTQALRPRARILRTFGDELISSETVAVIELVKNAYDADATRVMVRFKEPLERGKGMIEVIDNGHGMSLETIQTTWMEPATHSKVRLTRSERLGRRVLGEKGIGRFAASRLADSLEVLTRRAGMEHEVRVLFDWTQFDDTSKYLDEVEALWEEVLPSEIAPGGPIETLWQDTGLPEAIELMHGTILRMEGLRASWGKAELKSLRAGLSRLVLPTVHSGGQELADGFHILLDLPTEYTDLSGSVAPPEALRNPHYSIRASVDESGRYQMAIRIRGKDEEESVEDRFILRDSQTKEPRMPRCGPFHIELRVWDRDPESLRELAHESGQLLRDIRRDLDNYAGINIYRDGFRVLPYGDQRNDWLRLDLRRVQNPTLRLSNNQIVGYVLISADQNLDLRDQTNREGLMEGPAFDDLRELVTMVLSELEQRRYTARPRQEKPSRQTSGLFTGFDLQSIRALIQAQHPEATELLAEVEAKERDLDRRVEQVQEVIARYRRLATLGQLIDVVLHDGRAPLAKIRNEAVLWKRNLERGIDVNRIRSELVQGFEMIANQTEVLAGLFRRIEPFGGRKRGQAVTIRLEDVISNTFEVLASDLKEAGVTTSLPPTDTRVTVVPAEIQQVILNLLDNSLYWLNDVEKECRQISVTVQRKNADEIEVIFSDSGPGIRSDIRESIFEPYFSSKPNGIGLGLAIAGEIVTEYYNGSLELLEQGPLPGATFRITLQKRA